MNAYAATYCAFLSFLFLFFFYTDNINLKWAVCWKMSIKNVSRHLLGRIIDTDIYRNTKLKTKLTKLKFNTFEKKIRPRQPTKKNRLYFLSLLYTLNWHGFFKQKNMYDVKYCAVARWNFAPGFTLVKGPSDLQPIPPGCSLSHPDI